MLAAAVPNWRHGDLERLNEVLQALGPRDIYVPAPGGDVRIIPSGIIQIAKENSMLSFGPPNAKRTVATHFWKRYGLITHNAEDRMVYVMAQSGNYYPAEHVQVLPVDEGRLCWSIVICRIGSDEGDYEKVRQEVENMKGYIPKFLVVFSQRNFQKTFTSEATIVMQPFGSKLAQPGSAERTNIF
ncbi:hypothetical protein GCK72_012471 [Caenorhabditis remanei]|uniref:PAZ domain-containing protein n=1 Tax=Caenorhabditis remanei TaxID=31234 RepID=A0A6A5GL14_CAERE|nr:hypothetical protein GCK72_012471 [Caenorhabditis remanei]KAF1756018.1 hypothetical protein GCK72_012471 [Caenorhabditis remanei]